MHYPKMIGLNFWHWHEAWQLAQFYNFTWTTLTTKKRDNGNVTAISRQDSRVSSWANRLGPSSQTKKCKRIIIGVLMNISVNMTVGSIETHQFEKHYTRSGTHINHLFHWNWIQHQAAHPELRRYSRTCKLGCCLTWK